MAVNGDDDDANHTHHCIAVLSCSRVSCQMLQSSLLCALLQLSLVTVHGCIVGDANINESLNYNILNLFGC